MRIWNYGPEIVIQQAKCLPMIIKSYTSSKHKFTAEQNRRFDILMYIILTIVVLSLSIYSSI